MTSPAHQPSSEPRDLTLDPGMVSDQVGATEPGGEVFALRAEILALAERLALTDPDVTLVALVSRIVIGVGEDWWMVCRDCGEPTGPFLRQHHAVRGACRVCDERLVARSRGRLLVGQLRHKASVAQTPTDAATAGMHQSGGA